METNKTSNTNHHLRSIPQAWNGQRLHKCRRRLYQAWMFSYRFMRSNRRKLHKP